ncbi:unnamed protein product, partial [Iphiclides podalirius]
MCRYNCEFTPCSFDIRIREPTYRQSELTLLDLESALFGVGHERHYSWKLKLWLWPVIGDEEKLMQAVESIGSVAVAIDASQEGSHHYSEGVYYDENCSRTRR